MSLMEIELAKLDYRQRMDEAEQYRQERQRLDRLRGTGRLTQRAKMDIPVFGFRIGGFRYRLWFTRTVAL